MMMSPTSDVIAGSPEQKHTCVSLPTQPCLFCRFHGNERPCLKKPKCTCSKEQPPRVISGFHTLTQMSMSTHKRIHEKQNRSCVSCLAQPWVVVLLPAQELVGFPFSLMLPSWWQIILFTSPASRAENSRRSGEQNPASQNNWKSI